MLKLRDASTPVVVLRSDSHGGLNIMRSLGRLGVPVFNVDPGRWAPANWSRYCQGKFIWDIERCPGEKSLEYMHEVRRKVGRPCILIPTADRAAKFVADYSVELAADFIFPQAPAQLVHSLASKKEMFYLAHRHKIPTPDAAFPQSRKDVVSFLDRAKFPIMLKGIDGQRLWDRTGKKMFIVQSPDELLRRYDAVQDADTPNLMLQEYIPGGDNTVWMFNGYFDARSECLAGFTGKKIRQCPIHKGSTSLGICLDNPIVDKITRQFMKEISYRGALDIGYRYDARDGQYKVLDINPRIGATFRLFVGQNGMDVARALYLDLTGQEVVSSPAREGRKWIVEDLDLVSCCRYYCEGSLSVRQWMRSFRGIEEAAFVCTDDPLPIVAMMAVRFAELIRRSFRASLGKLRRIGSSLPRPADQHFNSDESPLNPLFNLLNRRAGS